MRAMAVPDRLSRWSAPGDDFAGIPCREWLGATVNGYGVIQIDRKLKKAHRVAYELAVGPVPEGLVLDHLCRNRACIEPAHLEPVTMQVNVLRGIGFAAENAQRTHCPQGHPYDEQNTLRYRGRRYCRACKREHARAWRARHQSPAASPEGVVAAGPNTLPPAPRNRGG